MVTETEERATATRRLILHDSLAFISLLLITAALFAVTLFLFRSFSAHREVLAHQWADRATQALAAGKPDQAIPALRTALSYAPGTRRYELLLAQALGEAGRTEESYNYFLGLWGAEPGSGFINLELARLAAKRASQERNPTPDRQAAVNFYRASIYGTWEGDGVARRAQVRLELARYLIADHELPAARMELLIAAGNVPDDPAFDLTIGNLLEQAEDPTDARIYYQKGVTASPRDPAALEAAGRLAYRTGDYETAYRMFARAEVEHAASHAPQQMADDAAMRDNAARILELMPAPTLPARERVAHILADRAIAKKRLDACSTEFAAEPMLPAALQALSARWAGPVGVAKAGDLLRDPTIQDSLVQLVYDTEIQTAKLCTPATGDDALLLLLANASTNPAAPQTQTTPTLPTPAEENLQGDR